MKEHFRWLMIVFDWIFEHILMGLFFLGFYPGIYQLVNVFYEVHLISELLCSYWSLFQVVFGCLKLLNDFG